MTPLTKIKSSSHGRAKKQQDILVDKEDLAKVEKYSWTIDKDGYAIHYFEEIDGESGKRLRHQIRMHRLIMGATEGQIVDHIDGNTLNNTKQNLRIVPQKVNALNRHKSFGKIKHVGVFWCNQSNRYCSRIFINGKSKSKYFRDLQDAIDHAHITRVNLIKELTQ